MARVPVATPGAGTQLRPLPDAPLRPAKMQAGLAAVGDAMQGTGQFLYAYADEQEKMDRDLDLAAVKKADNEDAQWLRDQLWNGDNAYFKQQGFNALNAKDPLLEAMRKRREEQLGKLTTDRQRDFYGQASLQRFGQEEVGVQRWATGQADAEEKRQSDVAIVENSNDAVTYWNDPARRDLAIGRVRSEVRNRAAKEGWAPKVAGRAEAEAEGNVHARIVKSLADTGKIELSHAYLEQNRDVIAKGNPDTLAALEAGLYKPLLERQAEGVADDLLGTVAPIEVRVGEAQKPGEVLPRMLSITAMSESRNRERDGQGRLVTSPKGAQGKMQVMPGTNLDPGFGVKPAADGSDAERTRVGRDYLAAMMKRYGNDPAKAWAAYNWGPGALDEAIQKHGSNWLANAPKETRDYVSRNIAALGGNQGGAAVQQAPREHDLTRLLGEVDKMNLPYDLEQAVRRKLTERVGLDETLLNRNREKAEEDAWRTVNGLGENGFTSISQLPPSVRSRLSPQQEQNFLRIAQQNVKAAKQGKDTDWTAYSTYSDKFASEPQSFLQIAPSELRANLGDTEFKQVMGWRQALLAGKAGAKPPEQVTHERIKGVTDPLLLAAGIARPSESDRKRTSGQEKDKAYWERRGKFEWSVAYEVEMWQKKHPNEEISDNVVRSIADANLIKMYRTEDGKREFAGYSFEVQGGKGISTEIPPQTRENLRQKYRARWGFDPSPAEIWEMYRYGPRGGRK